MSKRIYFKKFYFKIYKFCFKFILQGPILGSLTSRSKKWLKLISLPTLYFWTKMIKFHPYLMSMSPFELCKPLVGFLGAHELHHKNCGGAVSQLTPLQPTNKTYKCSIATSKFLDQYISSFAQFSAAYIFFLL